MNLNRDQVGHLGEMYVLYKLAKLGLKDRIWIELALNLIKTSTFS